MARKFNEENERVKRRYLQFLREAKRSDLTTVDKVAEAIGPVHRLIRRVCAKIELL